MAVLLDTGILVALMDQSDAHHSRVTEFLEKETETLVLPVIILPEISYLLLKHGGEGAEIAFLRSLESGDFHPEFLTPGDLSRALEILEQYRQHRFGLVDAMVMATAERLNIRRVATLDHRHFSVYRPRHLRAFELCP